MSTSARGSSALAKSLVARFQATFTTMPDWAWQFKPPVPLVGQRYRPEKSILVYASAENLAWLNDEPTPARFTTADAWNRYRAVYTHEGLTSADFFPEVGIAPVSNGGLLASALFVAQRLGLPCADAPRDFLELHAVGNWCKFIIKTERTNRDYIYDEAKCDLSLPFVVAELKELRPAVVLVPSKVWARPRYRLAMEAASPRTRFVPVPQWHATVLNWHLRGHDKTAARLRVETKAPLSEWMGNLRAATPANAWRYLAALNAALA